MKLIIFTSFLFFSYLSYSSTLKLNQFGKYLGKDKNSKDCRVSIIHNNIGTESIYLMTQEDSFTIYTEQDQNNSPQSFGLSVLNAFSPNSKVKITGLLFLEKDKPFEVQILNKNRVEIIEYCTELVPIE